MVGLMESAGDGAPGGAGAWLVTACAVGRPDVFGSIFTFSSMAPLDCRGIVPTFTVW